MSEQETQRVKRNPPLLFYVITTAAEWYVFAEILWYYLHDGEQTFHDAAKEWMHEARKRMRLYQSVRATQRMIRDLPETR